MKYDTFMRTRTYGGDYAWLNKPEYMPSDLYKTAQSIIALREKQNFDGLTEEEWFSCFYCFKKEGCCVLARIAKTKHSDSYGRSIYSFEGVSAKAEDEKRFFLDVPNLINAMMPPAKSFRDRFEEENGLPDEFVFEPAINPLKSTAVPDGVNEDLRASAAFKNLIKYIAFTENYEGFIFGKNANNFTVFVNKTGLGINLVFDYENPGQIKINEKAFDDNYRPIIRAYEKPEPTGTEKASIFLLMREGENGSYRYCWQVRRLNDGGGYGESRFSTKFYTISGTVPISVLELQKESIKGFLKNSGWTKQQIGLRFAKDTYSREEK